MLTNFLKITESEKISDIIIDDLFLDNKNLSFSMHFNSDLYKYKIFRYLIDGLQEISMKIDNFVENINIYPMKSDSKTENTDIRLQFDVKLSNSFCIPKLPLELSVGINGFNIYEKYYSIEKNIKFFLDNTNENYNFYFLDISNKKLIYTSKIENKVKVMKDNIKRIIKFFHKVKACNNYEYYSLDSEFDFFNVLDFKKSEVNLDVILDNTSKSKKIFDNSSFLTFKNININFKSEINSELFYINLKSEKIDYDYINNFFYGKNKLKAEIPNNLLETIKSQNNLQLKIKLANDYVIFDCVINSETNSVNEKIFNLKPIEFSFDVFKTKDESAGLKFFLKNSETRNNSNENLEDEFIESNQINNNTICKNNYLLYHNFLIDELEYYVGENKQTSILVNSKKLKFKILLDKEIFLSLVDDYELELSVIDLENFKNSKISENQRQDILWSFIKKFFTVNKIENDEFYESDIKNYIKSTLNMGIQENKNNLRFLKWNANFEKKFIINISNLIIDFNNHIHLKNLENLFEVDFIINDNGSDINICLDLKWDSKIESCQNVYTFIETIKNSYYLNINFMKIFKFLINLFFSAKENDESKSEKTKDKITFEIDKFSNDFDLYNLQFIFQSKDIEGRISNIIEKLFTHFIFIKSNISIDFVAIISYPMSYKIFLDERYYFGYEINSIMFDYKLKINNYMSKKMKNKNNVNSNAILVLDLNVKIPDFINSDVYCVSKVVESKFYGKFIYDNLKLFTNNENQLVKKKFDWKEFFYKYFKLYSCSDMIFFEPEWPFYIKPMGYPIEFIVSDDEQIYFYSNTGSFMNKYNIYNYYPDQSFLIKLIFCDLTPEVKSSIFKNNNLFTEFDSNKDHDNNSYFYVVFKHRNIIRTINFCIDTDYDFFKIIKEGMKFYKNSYIGLKRWSLNNQENFFKYRTVKKILKRLGVKHAQVVKISGKKHKKHIKDYETKIVNQFNIFYYYLDQTNLL